MAQLLQDTKHLCGRRLKEQTRALDKLRDANAQLQNLVRKQRAEGTRQWESLDYHRTVLTKLRQSYRRMDPEATTSKQIAAQRKKINTARSKVSSKHDQLLKMCLKHGETLQQANTHSAVCVRTDIPNILEELEKIETLRCTMFHRALRYSSQGMERMSRQITARSGILHQLTVGIDQERMQQRWLVQAQKNAGAVPKVDQLALQYELPTNPTELLKGYWSTLLSEDGPESPRRQTPTTTEDSIKKPSSPGVRVYRVLYEVELDTSQTGLRDRLGEAVSPLQPGDLVVLVKQGRESRNPNQKQKKSSSSSSPSSPSSSSPRRKSRAASSPKSERKKQKKKKKRRDASRGGGSSSAEGSGEASRPPLPPKRRSRKSCAESEIPPPDFGASSESEEEKGAELMVGTESEEDDDHSGGDADDQGQDAERHTLMTGDRSRDGSSEEDSAGGRGKKASASGIGDGNNLEYLELEPISEDGEDEAEGGGLSGVLNLQANLDSGLPTPEDLESLLQLSPAGDPGTDLRSVVPLEPSSSSSSSSASSSSASSSSAAVQSDAPEEDAGPREETEEEEEELRKEQRRKKRKKSRRRRGDSPSPERDERKKKKKTKEIPSGDETEGDGEDGEEEEEEEGMDGEDQPVDVWYVKRMDQNGLLEHLDEGRRITDISDFQLLVSRIVWNFHHPAASFPSSLF